ncbi:MAG: PatB family C-S lyase [Bacteroidales bacterium]
MTYDFDRIVPRKGTDCVKHDLLLPVFGKEDLMPMWVADMDFETPDFIREAVMERARHPVYGYTFRSRAFFETVAGWWERRHGWTVDPDHIRFSPGVVPALNLCVMEFTEPGDRILVQPPVYFPFFTAVTGHGRTLVHNPLVKEGARYAMDFDAMEEEFQKGVRMFVFCHPHNPVGRVWTKAELERVAELCLRYDVLMLSDEIHADLTLFGHRHLPLASLGKEIAAQCITCVAPSKTFNLAGLHSSAVILSDPGLRKRYDQVLERIHVGGGNLFGQVAMEAAYAGGDEWLNQLLAYLEKNFHVVTDVLGDRVPGVVISPLEATYLVWLDFRPLGLEGSGLKSFMLEEARLGLNDGPMFGPGGEGHQRLNIACPRQVLEEALERLRTALLGRG